MDPKKRELRKLKREVKRAGNKKRRHRLKQDLARNPEEAQFSEEKLGRYRSADFNGLDADSTRRRPADDEDATT
ncbi:MAG: hypothetical protein AB7K24_26695 [Gemmataceae bacterium]